jgi:hypothetical protein
MTRFANLKALDQKKDYLGLIAELKDMVAADKRVFTDPLVKKWCGRRWRNLFINAAAQDPAAVKTAGKHIVGIKLKDKRPARQKVAERFMRGDGPMEWDVEMPEAQIGKIKKTTLIFSPGLLTGMLPVQAFIDAFPALEEKYGWKILRSASHPMRGCEANVADLINAIEKGIGADSAVNPVSGKHAKKPGDVFLIGYSKGTPDALMLLIKRPDLRPRVRCLFNWAGAPGGSPLANNIYNSVKDLPVELAESRIGEIMTLISPVIRMDGAVMSRIHEFDIKGAVKDLTTHAREEFNAEHHDALDAMNLPIFNISGSTTAMEVPYFQVQGVLELNKYDANNDMQVTQKGAKVHLPMATDLAMLRGHHWDLSYAPFPKAMRFGSIGLDHPFPKEAAATAMFQFAAELGLID